MSSAAFRAHPWLALLVVLFSCSGEAPQQSVMQPLERFVGRRLDQRVGTLNLPAATIADERRFVLRAAPGGVIVWSTPGAVEDGVVRFEAALRPPFDRAKKILASLTLSAAGRSATLAPMILETRSGAAGASVAGQVPLPAELRDVDGVTVSLSGTALGAVSFSRYETRAVRVPPAARLDFGIGIVEPELGHDAIGFALEACAGDDCEPLFAESLDPALPEQRGWHDRSVPLEALAGRTVRFVFGARRLRSDAEFALPAWSNPTLYAPAPRRDQDLNVILVSIDTLRADHLPSYGYPLDTAPFIEERFAREGTLFEYCTAASPATAPSHMTIFTALQPLAHGVTEGLRVLDSRIRTLTEWIRAERIETAAFTENGWVSVHQGFARGFNVFSENKSAEIMEPDGEVDVTFRQAGRWLEFNRDKRFFLFLHTYQVHAPYSPPARYRGLFAEQAGRKVDESSPLELRYSADYDREIRFVDDELRALFERVRELGLEDRTVWILTSDHGEEFMDHGLLFHGAHLFEEVLRVPLLFRGSGIPVGRRVAQPVAQARLAPTILELLGVPQPPVMKATSLLALMRGREEGDGEPVYSEGWGTFQPRVGGAGRRFEPPALGVRVGSHKLTRYAGPDGRSYQLYDLDDDPGETRDLYAADPERAARLRDLLEAYEAEHGEELSRRARESFRPAVQLDPEREEKLRALGYLE